MNISEENLMAYADGEADPQTKAAIEAAMRDDPALRARIAAHRDLRSTVQGALSGVLAEPVPARLLAAARGRSSPSGNVTVLATGRDSASRRHARSWQPVAMAASLLLGVACGYWAWHGGGAPLKTDSDGVLVANGALAQALSNQLAADRGPQLAAVTGVSFRAKNAEYCRTFSMSGKAANSGLACRHGGEWHIKVLAAVPQAAGGDYRLAASAEAAAVRVAVEESIDGEALNQAGEVAARRGRWLGAAPAPQR